MLEKVETRPNWLGLFILIGFQSLCSKGHKRKVGEPIKKANKGLEPET